MCVCVSSLSLSLSLCVFGFLCDTCKCIIMIILYMVHMNGLCCVNVVCVCVLECAVTSLFCFSFFTLVMCVGV